MNFQKYVRNGTVTLDKYIKFLSDKGLGGLEDTAQPVLSISDQNVKFQDERFTKIMREQTEVPRIISVYFAGGPALITPADRDMINEISKDCGNYEVGFVFSNNKYCVIIK